MVGLGLSLESSELDLDRKIWQSAHLWYTLEMARAADGPDFGWADWTGGLLTIFLAVGFYRAAPSRPLMLKKTLQFFWVDKNTRWQ